MNLSKSVAARLQEVYLDGTFVANTNYKAQLSKVDFQQALQKVGNLNTIALLAYHINYYLEGLIKVLDGGALEIRDKYSFDMPEISSEEEWDSMKNRLFENAKRFIEQVRAIPKEEIWFPFVNEKYGTYLRNLEGVIEHSYYHLGQISIIRKMIQASNA